MIAPATDLAAAALDLVGSPFRLHGRDPVTGLDCAGLVVAALTSIGASPVAPSGYGLRNLSVSQWLPLAARAGLVETTALISAGDVLLIALAQSQHHLVIAADAQNVIHAHAGLRRVVLQPRDPAWQIHAHWRLAPGKES